MHLIRLLFARVPFSVSVIQSISTTLCNPLDCSPIKLLYPWNSPGKNCSVLPFPSPGDLPKPRIEPRSPTLQADSLPYKPPGKGVNFEQTPRDDERHHGQGNLACCSPCGHKESDTTEQLYNPNLWCFLLVIFYPVTPYSTLWPLFLFYSVESNLSNLL